MPCILGFLSGDNNKVDTILGLVKNKYVDAVDVDSMEDLAVTQILSSLDPHTVYLPPTDALQQKESLEGNFEGIGIEYFVLNDTILVTNVRQYSPAETAGLQKGDKIVAVNGEIFKSNTLSANLVVDKLRGKKGSAVKVNVIRGADKINDIEIIRGKILVSSVDAAYIVNNNTGFIKLSKFGSNTEDDFVQELQKMEALGVKNLILDLRGNGGGYLDAAIELTDQFLPKDKLIAFTKGIHQPNTYYKATDAGLFETGKIAVLVDEGTASASEIVAGALQDWDRGLIIGRRSFGKGLVQQQFEFYDGSAINLTIARYYTPSGRCIQKSYKNGLKAYKNEINQRFNKGEITSLDSNLTDTSLFSTKYKYKTAAGKNVYSGGGIMPDVFIPLDTTKHMFFYDATIKQQLISNFVYSKLIHQTQIGKYPTITDFINNYQISQLQYQQFITYCSAFKVNATQNESEKAKPFITKSLKAILIKYYYGNDGYYKYLNNDDAFVLAALQKM
ncbi:MAG: S41 family peptidase [Sphingobacteriales bacterium]|nr:MAG: S41 family peptidase [Sphingobacteriales bacterium]